MRERAESGAAAQWQAEMTRDSHSPEESADHQPRIVDRHVAFRMRRRRRELGITQERLARGLGITFQQVQKYERGANRVSAGRLFMISRALQVPMGYFFEGLDKLEPPYEAPLSDQLAQELVSDGRGHELAQLYLSIESAQLRRAIVELLRSVAEPQTSVASAKASPSFG